MKTANWAQSPRRSASAMSARTRRCKASRWRYFSDSSAASTCSISTSPDLAQQKLRQQRALSWIGHGSHRFHGPAIAQKRQHPGYAKSFKRLRLVVHGLGNAKENAAFGRRNESPQQDAFGFVHAFPTGGADLVAAFARRLPELLSHQRRVNADLLRCIGGKFVAHDAIGHAPDMRQQVVEGFAFALGRPEETAASRGQSGSLSGAWQL